jgi:hypothetical protein
MMSQYIAQRKLLFSEKGSLEKFSVTVQLTAPKELGEGDVEFQFSAGTSVCTVSFEGLPHIKPEYVYGADTLQAVQLASNVESILKRLSKSYDIYFPTGEDYFEE